MAESYIDKANKIVSELNDLSQDFIKAVNERATKEKTNQIPPELMKHVDRSVLMPSCPTTDMVPDMTEAQRQGAVALVESIKQEINANPHIFKTEEDNRTMDFGSKDVGYMDAVVQLVYVKEPDFMKEIRVFAASYKKKKGKEYFDPEAMVRGRLTKKKAKTKAKNDSLYLLLDVSGSMWYYRYKGLPLIQLMASYMPIFAQKFDGFWVQTDGARIVIGNMKELKKLKDKNNQVRLTGGSGADYVTAYNTIQAHSIDNFGEENPTIILFTDMADVFPNPMPRNMCVVTTSNKQGELKKIIADSSFPDERKGQKVILIDID